MEDKRPPHFQTSSSKLFHTDSKVLRLFLPNFEYFFFKIMCFFTSLCRKFYFSIIKLLILHAFFITTWNGIAEKIWDFGTYGHTFEFRTNFFFQLENIFRSNLKFSTFYGRWTDWKSISRLLLVSFL